MNYNNNNNDGILNNENNTNSFLSNYENIRVSKHSSAEEIAEKYLRNKLSYEYKYINKGDYKNINSNDYYKKNIDISDYKDLNISNYACNDELNYLTNKNNYSNYDKICNLNYDNNINKVSSISDVVNNSIHGGYSNSKNDEKKVYKNLLLNPNNVSELIFPSNSINKDELNNLNKFKKEKEDNYFMKNDFLKFENNNRNYKKLGNKEKINVSNIDELLVKYNNNNNSNNSLKYKYNINNSYVQNEKGRKEIYDKTIFTNSFINRTDISNNGINDHNNYYYNNRINKYYLDDELYNSKKKNLIKRNKDYVHYLSKRNSILKSELVVKKDLKKKKSVPMNSDNTYGKNKTKTNRYSNNSFFSSFYKNEKNKYNNEVELFKSINIFNNNNIKNNNTINYEKKKYNLNNTNVSNFYHSVKKPVNIDNINNDIFDISFLKSTYSDSSKIIDSPLNYDSVNLSALSTNIKKNDESLVNNLNISASHLNKESIIHYNDLGNKCIIDNSIYSENSLEKNEGILSSNINFVNFLNSNNNMKKNVDNNTFLNKSTFLTKNNETIKKSNPFVIEPEFSLNYFQNKNNISDLYIENEKLKNLNDTSRYINQKEKKSYYSCDLTKNNLTNKKNNYLNNTNLININKISTNINVCNKIKEVNNEYMNSNIKNNISNSTYENKKNNFLIDSNLICKDGNKNKKDNNHNLKVYMDDVNNVEQKNNVFVDNINNSRLNSLYFTKNKLTNIFNDNIKKSHLLNNFNNNNNNSNIYALNRKKGYVGNNNKQIEQNRLKIYNNTATTTTTTATTNTTNSNINNTTTTTTTSINNTTTTSNNNNNNNNIIHVNNYPKKTSKEKNNLDELNNINNYQDYCKYISDSINCIPINIKNMNILLALALYFLNFNINNNSTKNEFSDVILINLLNKFLYCLNLKTCLLKENKINYNENKYYYIQIKLNDNSSNNTLTDEKKNEYKHGEEKDIKNEENKNNIENNSVKTEYNINFFTFYNKRIVKNKNEEIESVSTKCVNNKNDNITYKHNDNDRKKCFYLDENMKIISLIDIYKIAWSLCVLKKNILYIDLLRILYKEVEHMDIENELIFCITYIFKYCNIIEIEKCKTYLNNNMIINIENNNNENLCMYLHLLHICSLHDEKYTNNDHKKNIDKIINYFCNQVENLNLYMCTNILCVLANLNIKNNDYPYFFNKMMNYFRNNIKKLNKSVLLVNIMWSLCICEVICTEFLKDISEYIINILHFIPLYEFITISCSFSCQKILIIKNYFENLKKTKDVKQEQKNMINISKESLDEYKNYELLINEYYKKKKIFPYYFYRKPICQSIIFKILAYNFLQYEQNHVINNNKINKNYFYDYKNTINNNNNEALLDLNNTIKKTNRSFSVENNKDSIKKEKEGNSANSRFNSSNIYRNIKKNNTNSEESFSFSSSSSFYKNNDKFHDNKSEYIINSCNEEKKNNNNSSSNNGSKLDNINSNLLCPIDNSDNIIVNNLKNNINKNKYFKKHNEKKKIKEYYNIYDNNNNYEYHLNSCERILFANLIEDCCNNFEELNSVNLIELLYTLCILNLDKSKIVKLVEKKIDYSTFNDNYEKLQKKQKYLHKRSDKEVINERNDLIILNYIYRKFTEEHIANNNDNDYNFSLIADNIHFCKYINDDIFLNIIKGNKESINKSTFYKLKNILNVATYKEKDLDKKKNIKESVSYSSVENDIVKQLKGKEKEENVRSSEEFQINNQNKQTDTIQNNIKNKTDQNNNFILNEEKDGTHNYKNHHNVSYIDEITNDNNYDNITDNYYNNKNIQIYNNVTINKEKEVCNNMVMYNNENISVEHYEKKDEKNHIINNSNELYLNNEKKNNLYIANNELKNYDECIEKESDDTSRQLNELKKDLKNTYDVAIAYYNNKTKYNMINNNKDNTYRGGEENEDIINSEIYNHIITKRNIKKILDNHKQNQILEEKILKKNSKEKNDFEKCRKNNNFNFYKLFILVLEFSICSLKKINFFV
ncbi:conserved Plasmodium protein, unknown function [Plasmodium gallinaceum]|uniref:Uncharacterized protein n=1 Tax=Plasmodium gallinaceum TaxID=5849 RepID=A0A1J1GRT3_PLAGA|nr:conserved Plasmodium protein, unknown function [Plasmodium gallinaceum]CRG94990.1 conserved Plasmodium protein, unknown function [Plasmodium gallinaceum]